MEVPLFLSLSHTGYCCGKNAKNQQNAFFSNCATVKNRNLMTSANAKSSSLSVDAQSRKLFSINFSPGCDSFAAFSCVDAKLLAVIVYLISQYLTLI